MGVQTKRPFHEWSSFMLSDGQEADLFRCLKRAGLQEAADQFMCVRLTDLLGCSTSRSAVRVAGVSMMFPGSKIRVLEKLVVLQDLHESHLAAAAISSFQAESQGDAI